MNQNIILIRDSEILYEVNMKVQITQVILGENRAGPRILSAHLCRRESILKVRTIIYLVLALNCDEEKIKHELRKHTEMTEQGRRRASNVAVRSNSKLGETPAVRLVTQKDKPKE